MMRARDLGSILALFASASASACASPAERPVRATAVPPAASSTAPTASSVDAAAPPADRTPLPVTRPIAVACKLATAHWEDAPKLTFAPGLPPWADLARGMKTDLEIGMDARGNVQVFATIRVGGLVLEGTVDEGIALHPTRAFQATPWLVLLPRASVVPVAARDGAIRVKVNLAPDVVAAYEADRTFERPCADLGVDIASFRATPAFGAAVPKRTLELVPATVVLFDGPGGAKLADLTVDGHDQVPVMEERDGHALVLFTSAESVVRGWVKRSELRSPTNTTYLRGLPGVGTAKVNGESLSSRAATCKTDTPLLVRRNGERWIVGRVVARTRMLLFAAKEGFVQIDVNAHGVWLHDVTFEVLGSDILGCDPT